MKLLLMTIALVEGVTGLALVIVPSVLVSILFDTSPLTGPGAILLGRLAGAALMTIAIACWLSRSETQSSPMFKAMLGYNVFAIILLVYAAIFEKLSGPGLWPAVIVHSGLLAWSLSFLPRPLH
jgi:hypothetical protein